MKKSILCLVSSILAITFLFVSCDTLFGPKFDNHQESEPSTPLEVDLGSIERTEMTNKKSICTTSLDFDSPQRSVSSNSIQTITYLDADGKLKPITFKTSKGSNVIVRLAQDRDMKDLIVKLNNNTIAFHYDAVYEVLEDTTGDNIKLSDNVNYTYGRALLNLETGLIYDFTDYRLNNLNADDRYIYAYNNETLCKIDIATKRVTGLNNPEFNPLDPGYDDIQILDNKHIKISNGTMPRQILFTDLSKPITELDDDVYLKKSDNTLEKLCTKDFILIMKKNNKLYGIYFKSDNLIQTGTISIDSSGSKCKYIFELDKEITTEQNIYPYGAKYLYTKDTNNIFPDHLGWNIGSFPSDTIREDKELVLVQGTRGETSNIPVMKIKLNEDNSFDIQIYSVPLKYNLNQIALTNNGFYYIDEDKQGIYFFSYSSRLANEIYKASNKILPEFKFTNNSIIFNEYTDATSVGTFMIQLRDTENTVSKLSESTVEIKNLVELEF